MTVGVQGSNETEAEAVVDFTAVWAAAVAEGRIQSVMDVGGRRLRFGLRSSKGRKGISEVEEFVCDDETGEVLESSFEDVHVSSDGGDDADHCTSLESDRDRDRDRERNVQSGRGLYVVRLHPGFREIYAKYDVSIVTRSEETELTQGANVEPREDLRLHKQRSELMHEEMKCSLCSGPNRLSLRPILARLLCHNGSVWDAHFNISPLSPSGHVLLLPDMRNSLCRRRQYLLECDVKDFVALSATALPRGCPGGATLLFNSIGGGASQNHIHAHLLVRSFPILSRLCEGGPIEAVKGELLQDNGHSLVELLEGYHTESSQCSRSAPSCACSCLRFSWNLESDQAVLDAVSSAVWRIVKRFNAQDTAFNVVAHGRSLLLFERTRAFTADRQYHLGACHFAGLFPVGTTEQLQALSSLSDICGVLRECSASVDSLRTLWKTSSY